MSVLEKNAPNPSAIFDLPLTLTDDMVENCIVKGQSIYSGDYTGTRFRRVVFQNCRFIDTAFTRGEFIETRFIDCDLSGADLTDSYWENSHCHSSKGVGIRISDSYLIDTALEDCNFRYADFSRCKWKGGALRRCDLREGYFTDCKLTRFALEACDLTRFEITRTPLKGLDLSDSVIDGLICSDNLSELRGVTIDPVQAVDIVRRLGIQVK